MRLCKKEVWVLEPRRIAAISAAHRIAEENNWTAGGEVGYQVRFENKSCKETKILFLTEALLLRKMLKDPELSQVDCVVLDEFHERSIHIDLALSALKELQELSRPDLKIVVMSATLDARPLSEYLGGAPILSVPGKVHPIDIHHEERSLLLKTDHLFVERMGRLIKMAFTKRKGDLLCFLPGRGEIERLKESLRTWSVSSSVALHSLHGQMSLSEQREALAPDESHRKVILSTNVAESSLTVPGVRIVVDRGLVRRDQQNLKTGLESLELKRISLASATQRAGRAAREGSGFVYRAWSVHDERSM
ncbi:MAG: ATP-dependent RNA helicase, partial [Bdellovibrionales bacterium]|nr:ATP-dependent RNA helicase [Bdellovibrionales bacterium]